MSAATTGKTPAGAARNVHRASKVGVVVSDKMDKTAVVAVERMVRHPAYKRIIRRTSRFFAHDEANNAHVGDQVEIVETRPMSRNKRWRIARIITRAPEKAREARILEESES
jgi:small subunit ribosomal protein S17